MPSTTPDGFEFESLDDEPGRTLHGGRHGNSPILAEQIQKKFTSTDAQLADLTARVAAIESGTGGSGWIPIATGNSSGASFTVDLTSGGKFPSPPLWNLVQIYMRVDLTAPARILCRVNGDNDLVYRSGAAMFDSVVPANSDADNWHAAAERAWIIAQGSTISTGNLSFTLFHSAVNPGLLSFQCTAARQSDDPSVHRHMLASGAITSGGKTANTLQFLVDGSEEFVNAWWWATGLRMEHSA